MTYKEYYLTCETIEQLNNAVENDVKIALIYNPDRVNVITKAFEEVYNLKFKEE